MPPDTDWTRYLGPGERVLWHGQPQPGMQAKDWLTPPALAGALLIAFGLGWTRIAPEFLASFHRAGGYNAQLAQAAASVGWLVVLIGLWRLAGEPLLAARVRGRTRYALSDKAAYVLSPHLTGPRLQRVLAAEMTPAVLDTTGETVWFAEEVWLSAPDAARTLGPGVDPARVRRRKIGFRRIADAPEVARLIGQLRAGQA